MVRDAYEESNHSVPSQTMMTISTSAGIVIVAPFIGSFIANAAVRLPDGRGIIFGRSACQDCDTRLRFLDLIPIVSWLMLSRKCRYCRGPISGFYASIELVTVIIALWAAALMGGWLLASSFCLGCWLLLLAILDARHYWLPDQLTLPLIPLGLLVCWNIDPGALPDHLIGAAAGFLVLFAIAKFYQLVRGRDGLGLGDAKLLAGLGAWVSWNGLPYVLVLAAAGGLVFVFLRARLLRQPIGLTDRIAFGPFLAMAGWLVWLYSESFSGLIS